MTELEQFLDYVDALVRQSTKSETELSRELTGSPDTFRDARRKSSMPGMAKLRRMAERLGTSVDAIAGGGAPAAPLTAVEAKPAGLGDVTRSFRHAPQNLRVVGTGHCADFVAEVDGQTIRVEQYSFDPDHIEAYVARPPVLQGVAEAYAIVAVGDSMYPRFGPGELAVADPRLHPRIGDDVVVQVGNGDGVVTGVLIKRLVRRSASFVELEQFNPAQRFRVDTAQVVRIHRLLTPAEMLGF